VSLNCPKPKGVVPRAVVSLLAGFCLGVGPAPARQRAAGQTQDAFAPTRSAAAAGPLEAHQAQSSARPDSRTVLPAPEVEMDVVTILAAFPKQERPYVQQVVHAAKDLSLLNRQCAQKAAVYAQQGLPKAAQTLDLSDVSRFNQGYLEYFDPLRLYMKLSYRRLYGLTPPARFEKAHKYWLAYLAYALENLDHQRFEGKDSDSRPRHSPVEVAQYRAWAYRLFKENGMDLTPYMVR